jgi:hypothetical protein
MNRMDYKSAVLTHYALPARTTKQTLAQYLGTPGRNLRSWRSLFRTINEDVLFEIEFRKIAEEIKKGKY